MSITPLNARNRLMAISAMTCGLLAYLCSTAILAQDDVPATKGQTGSGLSLDDLRTFTDVFNQVRKNYVEEVDDKELLETAISGMLSELDPHSAYLPGDDYESLDQNSRGEYVGIGVDVAAEDGRVVVRKVLVPSPADNAGIDPGDVLSSIAGKAVKGRVLQDAIDDLKGTPGSKIKLTVIKPDGKKKKLQITREVLKVPALHARLFEDDIAYFSLSYFHRDSATDLHEGIKSILADGGQIRGLIIDLRDNPGGVLQSAVDIADGFLNNGTIVSMRGRNAAMDLQFSATDGEWIPGVPLVLLVDRGSASASEVVAGAMQDHQRALILGEKTFGKGSVQSVLPLRNGGGIKLTTARYYTPSGRSIQAEGITPDFFVSEQMSPLKQNDERLREADLERHLESITDYTSSEPQESVDPEVDYPLYEALRMLRGAKLLSGKVGRP